MPRRIYATLYNGNQAMDRFPRGMTAGFGDRPWSRVIDQTAGPLAERGVVTELHLPFGRDDLDSPMTYEAGPARLNDGDLAEAYSSFDDAWGPFVSQHRTQHMPWPAAAYIGTLPRSPRITHALAAGDYRGAFYWLHAAIQPLVAAGVRVGFDAPFIGPNRGPDKTLLPEDHWSMDWVRLLRGWGLEPYLEGPPMAEQWRDLDYDWRTTLNLSGHARARVNDARYMVDWRGPVTGNTLGFLKDESTLDYLRRQARDLAPHWQQGRSVIFRRADLLAGLTFGEWFSLVDILVTPVA